MELLGNMRVEGAPSTFISLTEKVELGNVRVERQKLGEGGAGREEIMRGGEAGTLSMVGVWLGVGDFGVWLVGVGDWWIWEVGVWLGGVGEWSWECWADGSLFSFEGCSPPWWRETLTRHAEQKTEKTSLELKGQTSFHLRCQVFNILSSNFIE